MTRIVIATFAMPLLYVVFYSFFPPDVALLQPDSIGYLEFAPERTGGYPFFLAVLEPVIGDVRGYATAQLILFALCTTVLGWQLFRASNSMIVPAIAQLLLLCPPEITRYHFMILAESVFLSASVLFIASAIAYLHRRSAAALLFATISATYAAAIRPTGLIFLPATLLLVFLVRRERSQLVRHATIAIVALASILVLETAYYRAYYSGPRQSLAPIHILAKGALVDVPNANSFVAAAPANTQSLNRAAEFELESVRRLIADAPSIAARCRISAHYESFVQYEFAQAERVKLAALEGKAALAWLGLARIWQAPGSYLHTVVNNLYCQWTVGTMTNTEKVDFASFLSNRRPIPFDQKIYQPLATERSAPYAYVIRPIMGGLALVFAVTGIGVLWAALRGRAPGIWFALAGLCGLVVHASLLLTAATGVAIPRYTLGLWAPISLGALAAALWILNFLYRGRWREAAGGQAFPNF